MAAKDISVISNTLLRIVSRAQSSVYYVPKWAIYGFTMRVTDYPDYETVSRTTLLNTSQGDFELNHDSLKEAEACKKQLISFLTAEAETIALESAPAPKPMRWDMPVSDTMTELR